MKTSKYTREFRDSSVQLAMNSGQSALKIAADLDINPKTLYNWIREYKKAHNIKIDERRSEQRSSSKETVEDENRRLRAENKLLKQEREILKKAAAYFAKETL
jgi:transposase